MLSQHFGGVNSNVQKEYCQLAVFSSMRNNTKHGERPYITPAGVIQQCSSQEPVLMERESPAVPGCEFHPGCVRDAFPACAVRKRHTMATAVGSFPASPPLPPPAGALPACPLLSAGDSFLKSLSSHWDRRAGIHIPQKQDRSLVLCCELWRNCCSINGSAAAR